MKFLDLTQRFVSQHFPAASVVILAGSTSREARTPTSDIDVLILGDTLFPDERTSLAATYRFEGEIFEVFAYTEEGFATWANRGFEQYRPVIVQMLLDGITVRGDAERGRYRRAWLPRYEKGPVLDPTESAFRRYVLTDLLDDYADATDPLERHMLSSLLFERTAELILLTNSRWIGAGKYLPRRLREFDAGRAAALSAPLLDRADDRFAAQIQHELELAGGRVQEGFHR